MESNFTKSVLNKQQWGRILLLVSCMVWATLGWSQQQSHYTQFMYNKLGLNPGYAGSGGGRCFTGLHRSQWVGLEGAPTIQTLSFSTPLGSKRVGIGVNLTGNSIGVSRRWTMDGIYAYRLELGDGILGIGVQASARYFSMDYLDDRLIATQDMTQDASIPVGLQSKYLINFGAGLYYQTEQFYVGLSAPRLLKNQIDFDADETDLAKEVQHIYLMGGAIFELNDIMDLRPQILLKYAEKSPFDAEFNLSLIFLKKYTLGTTYRAGGSSTIGFGESIDLLLAAHITDSLLFGLSYDITLSEIKDYSNGSIEAILKYCIHLKRSNDVINPRFF